MTRLDDMYLSSGHSPWVDNIRRDWLNDGTLQNLVNAGARGVTSNPAIFAKAVASTSAYDRYIKDLGSMDAEFVFEKLAVEDVRDACDLLLPIYTASVREQDSGIHQYRDGFVSLEVSPLLAYDAPGTVAAALRLAAEVDRPNVMIKIPATAECLPAITEVLSRGINVNVTLIFSLQRYREVLDAFVAGVAAAKSQGRNIGEISSVASFFVSRVDTAVDPTLAADSAHRGRTAICQVAGAYQIFLDRWRENDAAELLAAGAQLQRPLWASTSVKNAAYDQLLYVNPLVAASSVNTMPDATLDLVLASTDEEVPSIANDDTRRSMIDELLVIGQIVDLTEVTDVLERDGVAAFISSYGELLATVQSKLAG
jgi:transaldolase